MNTNDVPAKDTSLLQCAKNLQVEALELQHKYARLCNASEKSVLVNGGRKLMCLARLLTLYTEEFVKVADEHKL